MWAPACPVQEPFAVPVSVPSAPTSTLTPLCLWARWWLGGASPQEAESCPLAPEVQGAEGPGGPAGRDHPLRPVRPSAAGGDILSPSPFVSSQSFLQHGSRFLWAWRRESGHEEPQARGQPGGDGVRRSRRVCLLPGPGVPVRPLQEAMRPVLVAPRGPGGVGESAVGGQARAHPAAVGGPGPAACLPVRQVSTS